jgi:hypothetical protein
MLKTYTEPKELWKFTPEGTMTQLTYWSYENSAVLLSFEPGDPTISMIFGDNYTNYHNLLADFDALNMSYTVLQDSYNELQSDREAITNELSTIRNLMYIFITTTILLIATTVYFATRKPKTKPET